MSISLYIHIPFCVKKCDYCDFISFPYTKEKMHTYLMHLNREIELYGKNYSETTIHTIFIGGGTPSLMSDQQMTTLMATIKRSFYVPENIEISMESNPGTLNETNLNAYKASGINRISMGVQTLEDDSLKTLGRIHDTKTVYESVALLKATGFHNFNLDLMFGLPGQSLSQVKLTLDRMIQLNPTHISAYSLKIEEGTEFYNQQEKGLISSVDDELDRAMYHMIVDYLEEHGYHQYEISNFAKEGYICRHNMVYWEKEDYLGIGLGAHGSVNHKRYYNFSTLEHYYNSLEKNMLPIEETTPIDKVDDIFEYIMLNLRLNKGLDTELFESKYDFNFETKYEKILSDLYNESLLFKSELQIALTRKGRDLSNQVFIKFLE